MASETASEELQGDNLGSIAMSTLFYCKNYGRISVLISVYEEFFQIYAMMEAVYFPIYIDLGERRSDSLLPSYPRLPGERSLNSISCTNK